MGEALLQEGAVGHDGTGEVGQVLLPKEGQGDLPQPLGQGHPAHPALHIRGKVGGVVLEPGGQKDQDQAHQAARQVKGHPAPAGDTAGHQVPNKEEQQPHRHHEGQVLQQAGQAALDQVPGALLGQGVSSL